MRPAEFPDEAKAAAGFLRRRVVSVRRPLAWVALAQFAQAALMIPQYGLLAAALDRALFAGAGLDALWPLLAPVPALICCGPG